MAKEATLYECNSGSCSLGTVGNPGHFAGGMTAEMKNVLTGTPVESLKEGTDFGEGICPNCGTKGKKVGMHTSVSGSDPFQKDHDKIAARVADSGDLLEAEGAQGAFLKRVNANG